MNEKGWMFHGGGPDDYTVYIGEVTIIKRTPKQVVLSSDPSLTCMEAAGYRRNVTAEEVYNSESECREAAAMKLSETRIYLEEKIARMSKAVHGQK